MIDSIYFDPDFIPTNADYKGLLGAYQAVLLAFADAQKDLSSVRYRLVHIEAQVTLGIWSDPLWLYSHTDLIDSTENFPDGAVKLSNDGLRKAALTLFMQAQQSALSLYPLELKVQDLRVQVDVISRLCDCVKLDLQGIQGTLETVLVSS